SDNLQAADRIPAYQAARSFASAVNEYSLRRYQEKRAGVDIDRLQRNSSLIPAKIVSGHCLGYDQEFLRENIRLCREARAAVLDCEPILKRLSERPEETLDVTLLLDLMRETILELNNWISNLERRVWW
ncbi:MAG TPA: hypothetical protein PKN80_04510, partial [bacterium]|nr:hypothetical protein [bacterium]